MQFRPATDLFKGADADATSPEVFRHPVRRPLKTHTRKFTVAIRFHLELSVLELTEIRIVVDKCLLGCLVTDMANPVDNRVKGLIQPKRENVQRCEAIA